jgi:hypothetical protein
MIVKVKFPLTVGVPLIVFPDKVKPAGSDPLEIEKVCPVSGDPGVGVGVGVGVGNGWGGSCVGVGVGTGWGGAVGVGVGTGWGGSCVGVGVGTGSGPAVSSTYTDWL